MKLKYGSDLEKKAPNSSFEYDHPQHGKLEVNARVAPNSGKVKLKSVGVKDDIHIGVKEAGISKEHKKAMREKASKTGITKCGDMSTKKTEKSEKMEKSERDVAVAILDKVRELAKGHNSSHVVEEGKKITPSDSERVSESKVDGSESDDVETTHADDKKNSEDSNRTERFEDQRHPEVRGLDKDKTKKKKDSEDDDEDEDSKDKSKNMEKNEKVAQAMVDKSKEISAKKQKDQKAKEAKNMKIVDKVIKEHPVTKSEKPLVAFLKKREAKIKGDQ